MARVNPVIRFRVGDNVSIPWFGGRRSVKVKQILAGGSMTVEFPGGNLHNVPTKHARMMRPNPDLLDAIRPGQRVTIVNRFGQEKTGKAVMRGPAGWVLNMGGPHGTPGIATLDNIIKVHGRSRGFSFRYGNPGPSALPSRWTPATVTRKGGKIQIRVGGGR